MTENRVWWWEVQGWERCPFCLQLYHYEEQCRCVDCDSPMCPFCVCRSKHSLGCPECNGEEKRK